MEFYLGVQVFRVISRIALATEKFSGNCEPERTAIENSSVNGNQQ